MNEWTPFVAFGPAHLGMLAGVALAAGILPVLARRLHKRGRRAVAWAIVAALLVNEAGKIVIRVYGYDEPLRTALPLHLCGLAALLTAWMLWQHHYRVYEIVYFWGVCGSVPAMLTPDLPAGFPHPFFIVFFTGHGLTLLGVFYATVVYGFRPRWGSIIKTLIATLLLAAVIAPLNLLLDMNYMYLRAKPVQPTLMDYLGPWPWYLFALAGLTVVLCLIAYAPFALMNRRRAPSEKEC